MESVQIKLIVEEIIMLRPTPPYILEKLEQGQYSGSFDGYVLYVNIEDIAIISNVFMNEGKQGAEALSKLLSEVVSIPINMVEQAGGLVCQFSGESFYAVFPEASAACMQELVKTIQSYFANHAPFVTQFGDYPVSMKQTLTKGQVHWQIFPNQHQYEFIFYGEPFAELIELRLNRGSVIISEAAKNFTEAMGDSPAKKLEISYAPKTEESFIRSSFHKLNPESDIFSAGYCFINLAQLENERWNDVISTIHDQLHDNGGYFHKLYISEIGLTALVFFGLPQATETTPETMCRFALEMVSLVPQLSIGLSWGNAFAGWVGREDRQRFVVLGTTVALAENLLFKSHPQEVITDSYLKQNMQANFMFEPAGTLVMSGISLPVKYFRIRPADKSRHHHPQAQIWGRDSELAWLKEKLAEANQKHENCLIVVKGAAGIGKSRLVRELLSSYQDSDGYRFTITSNAAIHYPTDGIRQIVSNYFHYDPKLPKEEGMALFHDSWAELAGSDPEMKRIETIIGTMLGYHWKNSIWSMLPNQEKGLHLQNAFVTFLQALATKKPVLLHLDKLQWLDGDSLKLLEAVCKKGVTPLWIVAEWDSEYDEGQLQLSLPGYQRWELVLTPLYAKESASILCSILQIPEILQATLKLMMDITKGNPLFIEQLARYLKESNNLDEAGNMIATELLKPGTGIQEIISSRIGLLPKDMLDYLQGAAILGKEFDIRVLRALLRENDISPKLAEGTKLGFWNEREEPFYTFSHNILLGAADNSIEEAKRKKLHLRAAVVMERLYSTDKESLHKHAQAIAMHYQRADEFEQAAQHYLTEGMYLHENYELEKAKLAFQEGITIHSKLSGPESNNTVFFLEKLGNVYSTGNEYAQAAETFINTLEIKKKRIGVEHLETAVTLDYLGNVYALQGKYPEAESCFELSVEIRKKLLGEEHHNTISSIINLASTYHRRGKFDLALELFIKTLDPRTMVIGAQNFQNADILNHLGNLRFDQRKYDMAEQLHTKAIEAFEKFFGREHPKTVEAITNLAKDYLFMKQYKLSEDLLIEAVSISEKIYGLENHVTATNIHNLGRVYMDARNLKKAEEAFAKALEIRKNSLGLFDPVTLSSYTAMAMLYYKMGMLDKAEIAFQQSLDIARGIYGNENIETAKIMFNLATVLIKLEKFSEAEPLYLEALVGYEKEYGFNHPETKDTLKHIIKTYQFLKQPEKVAIYQNKLLYADK